MTTLWNAANLLKTAFAASLTLAAAGGVEEAKAQAAPPAAKKDDELIPGAPVKFGVIGIGPQGREIMTSLAKIKAGKAQVVSYCDTYKAPALQKKSRGSSRPTRNSPTITNSILDRQDHVQAVFIATPSHKHKQIVLDAIAAGKHVYCEAPLASDLTEARDIAKGRISLENMIFMPGLQVRSNKQHEHVLKFVRSGALGNAGFLPRPAP